ncbi:MAG: M20/M25/M40 family metallo-hydrolase [Flavihumibacter sp.]
MKLFVPALLSFACFAQFSAAAQKLKKADKTVIAAIQSHVNYLADDKLEGRRAGTAGEQLAADYITRQFAAIGLTPRGEKGFLQPFPIDDGKDYRENSFLFLNGHEIPKDQFFVHPLSPEKSVEEMPSIALKEAGMPWFLNLAELKQANRDNPHFDLEQSVQETAKSAAQKGATALILYNDSEYIYNGKQKGDPLPIPVLFVDKKAAAAYLTDETNPLEVKLKTAFREKHRTGNNVIGYIDNQAPLTIVIGAHYDHLGYGEDGNSLMRTGAPQIHNGADDNASGTAALIEVARMIKTKKEKANPVNYLFIAFSGEELGLFGSKYFVEHPTIPLDAVHYMINMDMVGRLNPDTKGITIGGYGTSPEWEKSLKDLPAGKFLAVKYDSSGTGPSDHTSFYRKDIPVLFFFTGTHADYHKPSDDADKLNAEGEYRVVQFIYQLIQQTPNTARLAFLKTREQSMGTSTRFSVTLGIMPDYAYAGTGVHVDGVTGGRPAAAAGIQAGDVIIQLGDLSTPSVEEYMKALSKFKKGDKTTVKYKRGDTEHAASVVF